MIKLLVFLSDGAGVTVQVGQPMPGGGSPVAAITRMNDGTSAYRIQLENHDEIIVETGEYSVAPYQQANVATSVY